MRILFFIPFSLKDYAGNVSRIIQTIRLLSNDGHEVVVWCISDTSRLKEEMPNLGFIDASWSVKILNYSFRIAYVVNSYLVNKIKVYKNFSFKALRVLSVFAINIVKKEKIDRVWLNYVWSVELFRNLNVTVDLHDIYSNRHDLLDFRDWVSLSSKYENYLLGKIENIIAISYDEKILLNKRGFNSYYIPYLEKNVPINSRIKSDGLLFIGSDNIVNRKSIDYIKKIVDKRNLDFHVYGKILEFARERLGQDVKGDIVFSDMKSLIPLVTIGINFPGKSTGLKIKSIDYLRHGLVLLCDRFAVDQYLIERLPDSIIIVDDVQNFRIPKLRNKDFYNKKYTEFYENEMIRINQAIHEIINYSSSI